MTYHFDIGNRFKSILNTFTGCLNIAHPYLKFLSKIPAGKRKLQREVLKAIKSTMPVIKFLTSDDIIIETDDQIAQCSDIIRPLLVCCTEEGDPPKLKVSAAILRKVLEWAEHHKYDPAGDTQCINDPWDTQFVSVDQSTLFELIQAANYLNIKGLLTLTCKAVANMITGKTPDEIRKLFEIKTNSAPAGEYYD